ncbi:hypothetical protein FRACYDRAFT_247849 [Fragilariopsis cylindrus CCMP1102]|uniref:Uncharacterized protein n=1 Tax=Fragilariopsis cylindrus CCMP1102 TaxID=635003 RepID=A0A1E7EWP3_9STRA|nr:hypothetical protein FRACYDRAFT_247849 [Fragilariopsis cylindrus CCMP1102]|eukprot:OEU10234.1 hypothetical protein FRACYDRAFT_247849 [Fragilariopsis cylindrus CCMP1102]
MDDVVVTTSVANAAEQILSRSFAIYRVNAVTANKIRDAHQIPTAPDNKELFINRYQRIVNGNLHGYNVLPSKELFRTWYKDDDGDKDNDGEVKEQPWPSEDLCKNTLLLAKDLHRLLTECIRHIIVLKKNQQQRHLYDSTTTKRTDNDACSDLVCIMTGNQLSQLLLSTRETTLINSNTATTTNRKASKIISEADYYPPACVHRVRNPLKRARLSISYELRLD